MSSKFPGSNADPLIASLAPFGITLPRPDNESIANDMKSCGSDAAPDSISDSSAAPLVAENIRQLLASNTASNPTPLVLRGEDPAAVVLQFGEGASFRVLYKLGQGAFGKVYAVENSISTDVTVTVTDSDTTVSADINRVTVDPEASVSVRHQWANADCPTPGTVEASAHDNQVGKKYALKLIESPNER